MYNFLYVYVCVVTFRNYYIVHFVTAKVTTKAA